MADQCQQCRLGDLIKGRKRQRLEVAGRVFEAELDAQVCDGCGAALLEDAVVERFERAVALALSAEDVSGEAFAWMRKALGLSLREVAALFQRSLDEVRAWETGRASVRLVDWLFIGQMVKEMSEGSAATRERIVRLGQGARPPETSPVALGHLAAPAAT